MDRGGPVHRSMEGNPTSRPPAFHPGCTALQSWLMRFSLCVVLVLAGSGFAQEDWQVQHLVAIAKYPMLARMVLIQGAVELRCSILEDGSVSDCRVNSGHPLLALAAIENVKLWTFRRTSESRQSPKDVALIYTFELCWCARTRRTKNGVLIRVPKSRQIRISARVRRSQVVYT